MTEDKIEEKDKIEVKNKTTFAEHARNTIKTLKESASLEIMKPVYSRIRTRVREIQKLSQAVHTKIPIGRTHRWHTEPPKMFICGLDASIINKNLGIITYQVYKTETGPDGNLRKKLVITEKEVFDERTGQPKKITTNARYEFEKLVEETIEYKKPIKIKEYMEDVPTQE